MRDNLLPVAHEGIVISTDHRQQFPVTLRGSEFSNFDMARHTETQALSITKMNLTAENRVDD